MRAVQHPFNSDPSEVQSTEGIVLIAVPDTTFKALVKASAEQNKTVAQLLAEAISAVLKPR